MVEGGQNTHTQFLAAGLADELQLVIAPFFVGDPGAPRFVGAATFPWESGHRMTLAESRQIGDVVLLRYLLTPRALGEQPVAQGSELTGPINARDCRRPAEAAQRRKRHTAHVEGVHVSAICVFKGRDWLVAVVTQISMFCHGEAECWIGLRMP
jgi:RibD C-terminal domain